MFIRFRERTRLAAGIAQTCLIHSFDDNILEYHNQGYRTLVACQANGLKFGYFVIGRVDDDFVVHTFLFLTNEGTPEGKKLKELAQLERLDKDYLGLDSLAAYVDFDIKTDPRLKEIFYEAGCGSLLEFADFFIGSADFNRENPDYIAEYIFDGGEEE